MDHYPLGAGATAFQKLTHTGAENRKASHPIGAVFPPLLSLFLLLLMDVADASHQLPAAAIRIVNRPAGERHPPELFFPRPARPKLHIRVIGGFLHRGYGSLPVRLVDIFGID